MRVNQAVLDTPKKGHKEGEDSEDAWANETYSNHCLEYYATKNIVCGSFTSKWVYNFSYSQRPDNLSEAKRDKCKYTFHHAYVRVSRLNWVRNHIN